MHSWADGQRGESPGPLEPVRDDSFGAMLLDCWERGAEPWSVIELIERDDGFLAGGDAARYFATPADWSPLEREACDRARGGVLDIGAGAGRVSLYLQERDFDVVALDVSPLAADVCRGRGVREVFVGTVFDLAATSREKFDTFLMLGNTLGLLESADHAPRFLRTLGELAAPDAQILAQGTDPYATDDPVHLAYHAWNRRRGRMSGQLRLRVRYRDTATDWFDYLLASVEELKDLVRGTGWVVIDHLVDGGHYLAMLRQVE